MLARLSRPCRRIFFSFFFCYCLSCLECSVSEINIESSVHNRTDGYFLLGGRKKDVFPGCGCNVNPTQSACKECHGSEGRPRLMGASSLSPGGGGGCLSPDGEVTVQHCGLRTLPGAWANKVHRDNPHGAGCGQSLSLKCPQTEVS